MLGDDLLFGVVGHAAADALTHHLGKALHAAIGFGRQRPLGAGALGADVMRQAFIDALIDIGRQRDGGHFDIGGGIGAFGLASAVIKQRLFQQQARRQPVQRG